MKKLGLYIHIPFCRSKCLYCDFCSFPRPDGDRVKQYISALRAEIGGYAAAMRDYTVDTVFFGGGTPTFLDPSDLIGILEEIRSAFALSDDAEITTECNPATVDFEVLSALRQAGFNRLSLGAQSLIDAELKALGRIHSAPDFVATLGDARRAGFDNVNVDLMFGIPLQTAESFRHTLSDIVSLAPEHLSLYGLILEENTPFYRRRDTLPLPDEDTERAMYMEGAAFLEENGYRQYEISNFARGGFASRHNLKYWLREDYLGLGLAAHSCLGNKRFYNTSDINEYLLGNRTAGEETLSRHDVLCERIMLSMRLADGCDFTALGDAGKPYLDTLLSYEKTGLVKKTPHGAAFTKEGFYVSNSILSDVLDFED